MVRLAPSSFPSLFYNGWGRRIELGGLAACSWARPVFATVLSNLDASAPLLAGQRSSGADRSSSTLFRRGFARGSDRGEAVGSRRVEVCTPCEHLGRWQRVVLASVGSLNQSSGILVDPASSHMLVSKIKPCMSKFTPSHGETANGSLNQSRFLR